MGRDIHRNVLVGHCQHPHHLRKRRPAHEEAQEQPQGDADAGQPQGLAVDEAADLLAAHADGAVQAVAADVLHDGDVKNIVDQQVPAEDEEEHQGRPHGQHRQGGGGVGDGVHHGGQGIGGASILRVAPYAAGPVVHGVLEAHGTGGHNVRPVGAHHLPVCGEGVLEEVRVGIPEGGAHHHGAHLVVGGLIPTGDHHVQGVGLPPRGELDGHRGPRLRLAPQVLQGGIGGHHLVGGLGHAAVAGVAEEEFGLGLVHHVQLHVMAGGVFQKAHGHPQAVLCHEVCLAQGLVLLGGHVPEVPVRLTPLLHLHGEGHGLHGPQGDGGHRGEEEGGEGNGQHRHEVPGPAGGKTSPGQQFQHWVHVVFSLLVVAEDSIPGKRHIPGTFVVHFCTFWVQFLPSKKGPRLGALGQRGAQATTRPS